MTLCLVACDTQPFNNNESNSVSNQQTEAEKISITLNITVDGKPIKNSPFVLTSNKKETLLDVMKKHLTIVENTGYISSINGIEHEPISNKWWIFDYNGVMSEVGAAEVKLNNGDIIDWKLESFE